MPDGVKPPSLGDKAKTKSFKLETASGEGDRAKTLAAFKNSKFSKSLTGEEVTAIDPESGQEGKWVRPHLRYDPSSEHVPPPPPGPIPKDILAQESPPKRVLTKRSSGVSFAPPPPPSETAEESKPPMLSKATGSHKSSFAVNTASGEEERAATLDAFRTGKFSKSLTAEVMLSIDPESGQEGKWVRPHLRYDPSSEHVPPPPPGPIPDDVLATPRTRGTTEVTMPVVTKGEGSKRSLMAKRSSGVNFAPPPPPPETKVEKVVLIRNDVSAGLSATAPMVTPGTA